jgi:tetratricopeptide (TPR) repeat protein
MKDYLYIDSNDDAHQFRFKVSQTPKVNALIKEEKFDEALDEINRLLKTDSSDVNWNCKGIILDKLSKHDEAIECFDKSLSLNQSRDVQLNKANALYNWAKITFFPKAEYDKSLKLIDCSLDAIPEGEDSSEFYFLKAEILEALNRLPESYECYLIAYNELDKLDEFKAQHDYLQNTDDTLINIVGGNFYEFTPKTGDILTLIKDEENEHDPDAIAVTVDDETVGYVANNPYTLIDEVKSASNIKNMIMENQQAEILFIYIGEYVIAKLI